jgi:hypothetical protein
MFTAIRGRITYASVALTLALLFAMSGGAYAAKRYLITSTQQISPKVLKQLHGASGAPGAAGAGGAQGPAGPAGSQGPAGGPGPTGPKGPEGAAGKNGENGKEGSPWTLGGLPKGASETGTWTIHQDKGARATLASIPFPVPLAKELDEEHVHFIAEGETPPTGCSGSFEKPAAASGNLCVFTNTIRALPSLAPVVIAFKVFSVEASAPGAGRTGAYLSVLGGEATEEAFGTGDWVVTG